MFEIAPSVTIDAPVESVWDFLVDIDRWWIAFNADHEALEIFGSGDIALGARIRVEETVAGLSGVAEGVITAFDPWERITWEASAARYRFFGLHVTVSEGVTWKLAATENGTDLTAAVWASFPVDVVGTLVEWIFIHVLDGAARDFEHAMRELDYIKEMVENQTER